MGERSYGHDDMFEASFPVRWIDKRLVTVRRNESGQVSAVGVPELAEFERLGEKQAENK